MDCRQALTELADLSAESLAAPAAQDLMRHLADCPQCDEEWKAFQLTLFRLSAAPQTLPSSEQSRRIWAACLEEVSRDVEAKRESRHGARETGFFKFAPRWSWAMLGGAAAVMGGVWLLAPHAETSDVIPLARTANLQSFQNPPALMSPLVTHHTAFAFDAFNDHSGTSLISYGATAPVSRNTKPAISSP